jgi:hypothetical protein
MPLETDKPNENLGKSGDYGLNKFAVSSFFRFVPLKCYIINV